MSQYSVQVHTDGACENNGKEDAKGGIGVYWGPNDYRNVSEALDGRQTNNRAEIQAAVRGIRQAEREGFAAVTITTDSRFLIDSVTKWMKKWRRNGWKTVSGKEVDNRADFEDVIEASEGIHVQWEYVKAHSGNAGNEAADQLAREGIKKHSLYNSYTDSDFQLKMANNCATGSGTSKKFTNDRPFIKVKIGNLTHPALIATGSAGCVIGKHLFEKTGYSRNSIQKMEDNVRQDFVGNSYKLIGQVMFKVKWANQVTEVPFIIVPKQVENRVVLGNSFLGYSGLFFNFGGRKMVHDELGIVIPFEFVEVSNIINVNYINI